MKVKITLHNKDGEPVELLVEGKYEVCSRCNGHGTHTNPSIDGNGLSEDCLSDPDFMEGYMSGSYDVTCTECQGVRVVPVPDYKTLTYAQKRLLIYQRRYEEDEAESRRYAEAERRFCSGERW